MPPITGRRGTPGSVLPKRSLLSLFPHPCYPTHQCDVSLLICGSMRDAM